MKAFVDILRRGIFLTAWPMETPAMFGMFHLSFVFFSVVLCAALVFFLRRITEKQACRLLAFLGWALILSEVYKQLFYYFVVNGEKYNWWWFPFQLCSVPMYLGAALPFLKEKSRHTVGTFLGTYTLLGTIAALAIPADMLRPYLTMTWHAFLWHAVLLLMSLLSIANGLWRPSFRSFLRATALFFGFALLATGINLLGEKLNQIPGTYPNMFYITPYHHNTQPVFQDVSARYGITAGNLFYLTAIVLLSGVIHGILCFLTRKKGH